MTAGVPDLLHVAARLRERQFFFFRQIAVSDDRVQRRPDIVRHVGQECCFRLAGLLRCLQRDLQFFCFLYALREPAHEKQDDGHEHAAAEQDPGHD